MTSQPSDLGSDTMYMKRKLHRDQALLWFAAAVLVIIPDALLLNEWFDTAGSKTPYGIGVSICTLAIIFMAIMIYRQAREYRATFSD